MLAMATSQIRHPIALLILMETPNRLFHDSLLRFSSSLEKTASDNTTGKSSPSGASSPQEQANAMHDNQHGKPGPALELGLCFHPD